MCGERIRNFGAIDDDVRLGLQVFEQLHEFLLRELLLKD
jgi:hypothetical protein